jgi:hypothetical protein
MEFKNHTPESVAELLLYLAEHESFQSVKALKEFTRSDVTNILKELAANLQEFSRNSTWIKRQSLSRRNIPDTLHSVIANLSPKEEETLWKSFKIS